MNQWVIHIDMENKLQKLMDDINAWSSKVFGSGQRNPAILHHLKEEVGELIFEFNKLNTLFDQASIEEATIEDYSSLYRKIEMEYADCFMLLLDSAFEHKLSAEDLIRLTNDKLSINKKRKWKAPDENGVINHDKFIVQEEEMLNKAFFMMQKQIPLVLGDKAKKSLYAMPSVSPGDTWTIQAINMDNSIDIMSSNHFFLRNIKLDIFIW